MFGAQSLGVIPFSRSVWFSELNFVSVGACFSTEHADNNMRRRVTIAPYPLASKSVTQGAFHMGYCYLTAESGLPTLAGCGTIQDRPQPWTLDSVHQCGSSLGMLLLRAAVICAPIWQCPEYH